MGMEKIVFADTFRKGIKSAIRLREVVIDDPVFRLHYTATAYAMLFFSVLVSGYQFIGNPIMCIQRDQIPKRLLNNYCWIEGTFSLPKALTKVVGVDVVYPGVEKYEKGDEVIEHSYYQWVCFVLLLQSLLFCVPHVIWKAFEGGRMVTLVQKLKNPVLDEAQRETNYQNLASYFHERRFQHQQYTLKYIFCEILNFVNVVGQMYLLNRFLGGQFIKYGADVLKFVNEDQLNRADPMIQVFPRITKCTFHKFGSSGDVQKHDALCLLPLNIINEKIFIIMWFWFIILATLDAMIIAYRLLAFVWDDLRCRLLHSVSSLSSKEYIRTLIRKLSYGDWFILYLLAYNVDNVHFSKFLTELEDKKYPVLLPIPRMFRSNRKPINVQHTEEEVEKLRKE